MSLEMDPLCTTYKTELCAGFQRSYSVCENGHACIHAHGVSELRRDPSNVTYDTDLCDLRHDKRHNNNYSRCPHAHNSMERSWHPMRWHTEMCMLRSDCTGKLHCPFAHTKREMDQGRCYRKIYGERVRERYGKFLLTTSEHMSVTEELHLMNKNIEKLIAMLEENILNGNP